MRFRLMAIVLMSLVLTLPTVNSQAATKVTNKAQATKAVKQLTSLVSQRKTALAKLQSKEDTLYSLSDAKYAKDLAAIDAKYSTDISIAKANLLTSYDALDAVSVFISQATNVITCGTFKIDSLGIINFSRACAMGEHFNYPYPRLEGAGKNGYVALTKMGVLVPVDNVKFQNGLAVTNAAKANIERIDNQHAVDSQKLRSDSTTLTNSNSSKTLAAIDVADALLADTKLTLLASKRASLSGANFETAFATAYKFSYNYNIMLQIAQSPFDTINSIYSLIAVQYAVNRAYDAGAIDVHYTEAAARNFNQSLGNAFTGSDTDFATKFSRALKLYRSSAK